MRCQYCDYFHKGHSSLYNDGIEGNRQHRSVAYREEVDKFVCNSCWNLGRDFPDDDDPNSYVDLDFDSIGYEEAIQVIPIGEEDY